LLASLEGARQLSLDLMPTEEAVRLLAALAGEGRVAAEPEAAVEVVRLCGNLPLAIRIAGARLRARPSLAVSGLAGRLADEHRRLNELTVGDLGVRASFMLSYEQLAPDDARIFRRLGVLNGPDFGVGVVAALAGADPAHPEDVDETELAADAGLEVLVPAGRGDRQRGPRRPGALLPERAAAHVRPRDDRPRRVPRGGHGRPAPGSAVVPARDQAGRRQAGRARLGRRGGSRRRPGRARMAGGRTGEPGRGRAPGRRARLARDGLGTGRRPARLLRPSQALG
jgi:hypothetical protein